MPPAISDDEESNPGVTSDIVTSSVKKTRKSYAEPEEDEFDDAEEEEEEEEEEQEEGDAAADTKQVNGGDEEEEDDEDMDEDEYVVEKIFAHYIAKDGRPRFQVKWEGYEKMADRTWEEEENLQENASEALKTYFKSIGGREKIFEETKEALTKRKRKGASATPSETKNKRSRKSNGHPLDSTPPASAKAVEWKPPSGSWEDEVETADMCQDEESGNFIVYLTWKNGKKTQHPKEVVYRRCPQKMLRFYEQHIRISRDGGEPVPIGDMTQLLQEERDEINSRQSSRSSQFDVVDFVFDYGLLMILLVIVAAIYFGALHLT